jgi:CsoR family transcriptional regulator, copper-sensing transcriptional repressor
MSTRPETADKDVIVRLRRIEGQIRGIQRMVEEERACEQMLTQLMAVRAGVDQVGLLLLETHIENCLLQDIDADAARLKELRDTLKMWARFGLLPGAALPWSSEGDEA